MSEIIQQSKTWEVPSDFSNRSFSLMELFALGDSAGTNISSRPDKFGDDFLQVACKKCCLPQKVIFEEVKRGGNASFLSLFQTTNPFEARTPLKVVGHLRMLQKNGGDGFLAVNGVANKFICRSKKKGQEAEVLKVVTLTLYRGSWIIEESDFTGESHVFEGPCRVFFSVR